MAHFGGINSSQVHNKNLVPLNLMVDTLLVFQRASYFPSITNDTLEQESHGTRAISQSFSFYKSRNFIAEILLGGVKASHHVPENTRSSYTEQLPLSCIFVCKNHKLTFLR